MRSGAMSCFQPHSLLDIQARAPLVLIGNNESETPLMHNTVDGI